MKALLAWHKLKRFEAAQHPFSNVMFYLCHGACLPGWLGYRLKQELTGETKTYKPQETPFGTQLGSGKRMFKTFITFHSRKVIKKLR